MATAAAICLTLALPACGGSDSAAPQEAEPAGTTSTTETDVAQPPPETGPEEGDTSGARAEAKESEVAEEAASAPEACPDVVITPGAGDGLFEVEVEGITCADAATALQAWGGAGYPGDGPPGFACDPVAENADGSTRLRCTPEGSVGTLEFTTGG